VASHIYYDKMEESQRKNLESQHYKVIGNNTAVKLCLWTKRSIVNKDVCYKEKFYGIKSHRCLQMSPSVITCNHKCIFCWRNPDLTSNVNKIDDPSDIIEKSIAAQRKLLSGFFGNRNADIVKLKEAQNPNQVAISLSGEPLMYPRISELVDEFKKKGFSVFVVSNGTIPEKIPEVKPSQLYISLNAPNEEIYKMVCRPELKNGWGRINKSLELLRDVNTKKVIRITLIKKVNMFLVEDYAKLIKKAEPDFVECKSFMFVGGSRTNNILSLENMPTFNEILEFSNKLCDETGYKIKDYKENSRVVLLKKI